VYTSFNTRKSSPNTLGVIKSKIEKNELDGAFSAYGGKERRIQDFDGET